MGNGSVNRRDFLKTTGTGALGSAAAVPARSLPVTTPQAPPLTDRPSATATSTTPARLITLSNPSGWCDWLIPCFRVGKHPLVRGP